MLSRGPGPTVDLGHQLRMAGLRPETPGRPTTRETLVSTTDYLIDILLIVVIFRQVRPHQLTPRAARLPILLLIVAGIIYLRPPFNLGGNDLVLIVILALAGVVLGALSGMADTVWRDGGGILLFRAGVLSVVAWLVGMGFRLGFAYYAYHSGGPSIASFSVRHDITGAHIWTTALFLMAAGQVLARLGVLQLRRVRAGGTPATRQPRRGRADRYADIPVSQSEAR